MAIDTAEKRRSVAGIEVPGVTPNSDRDREWRQQAAGSYSGILPASEFQPWTVGTADFRFLKSKIVIKTADGLPVITAFKTVLDVTERTEKKEDVTVEIGGTSITFAQRFHLVPNLQVTARGTTARYPLHDNETVTGFDISVFDASGTDVGGTVDWIAVGA